MPWQITDQVLTSCQVDTMWHDFLRERFMADISGKKIAKIRTRNNFMPHGTVIKGTNMARNAAWTLKH